MLKIDEYWKKSSSLQLGYLSEMNKNKQKWEQGPQQGFSTD